MKNKCILLLSLITASSSFAGVCEYNLVANRGYSVAAAENACSSLNDDNVCVYDLVTNHGYSINNATPVCELLATNVCAYDLIVNHGNSIAQAKKTCALLDQ